MADIIVKTLDDIDFSEIVFPIITLYDHPKDYPGHYVARIWEGKSATPTNTVILYKTLQEVEKCLGSLLRLERRPEDDPCILCVYLL